MNTADLVFQQPWIARAGWTLVHFLWQGSVIVIGFAILRATACRTLKARGRYALSCAAFATMVVAPALTFLVASALPSPELPRAPWPVAATGILDRLLPRIVAAWLIGVVFFSTRIVIGWLVTARLKRRPAGSTPVEWQRAFEELMLQMRISAPARLLASARVTVPAVVGWLQPVILMPVETLAGLPAGHIRALLAHELAHIRRHDYLMNILQSMAEALLFYHPAVWWISRQIRAEREACCDDLAVQISGDVLSYATALARLDANRRVRLRAAQAADGASLLDRIRRLAGEAEPLTHNLPGVGAVAALALLWITGIGAVALHARPAARSTSAHTALRPFVPPGIAAAPPLILDAPPPQTPRMAPALSALLFDPFFAPPQSPVSAAQAAPDASKLASFSGVAATRSGKPVTKAVISLIPRPSSADPSSAARMVNRSAQTDGAGRFSIDALQPGEYILRALHGADLPGALDGAEPNATLSFSEGQQRTGTEVFFIESGTVSGRVVDEDGDPLARMNVEVQDFMYYNGRKINATVASATSDDNGEFKVQRVPPGRYILRADTQPTWTLPARAPIPVAKPGQKDMRPHCTYYGGTHDPRTAVPIDVVAGQDLPVGKVRMLDEPTLHVRGRVLGDLQMLEGARVVRMPGSPASGVGWSYGASIAKDGSFDMANMWPDHFAIEVFNQRGEVFGWTSIEVGDDHLNNVVINAMGGPMSGVIKWETDDPALSSTSSPVPPSAQKRVQLTAFGIPEFLQLNGPIRPDNRFTIPLVAPGRYLADVAGLPVGSYVKGVRFNGMDVRDQGLEWGSDQKGTLEVLISSKAAIISGTVQDAQGKPLPATTVTLVPDPAGPPNARLFPSIKTDEQGNFRFATVTPGRYRVYAWEEILNGAHWDPEFTKPFLASSERVDVEEGGSSNVTLKRISKQVMVETLRRAGQ